MRHLLLEVLVEEKNVAPLSRYNLIIEFELHSLDQKNVGEGADGPLGFALRDYYSTHYTA